MVSSLHPDGRVEFSQVRRVCRVLVWLLLNSQGAGCTVCGVVSVSQPVLDKPHPVLTTVAAVVLSCPVLCWHGAAAFASPGSCPAARGCHHLLHRLPLPLPLPGAAPQHSTAQRAAARAWPVSELHGGLVFETLHSLLSSRVSTACLSTEEEEWCVKPLLIGTQACLRAFTCLLIFTVCGRLQVPAHVPASTGPHPVLCGSAVEGGALPTV